MQKTHGLVKEWATHQLQRIDSSKLVRYIVLYNVSILRLFFILKESRNDKIYKKTSATVPVIRNIRNLAHRSSILASYQAQPSTNQFELIEARSGLPSALEVYLKYCHKFTFYYNWYLLMKHLIAWLQRFESFASLNFLDCFLLGRFVVNGRVIQVANTCACYLIVIQLFWIYLLRSMKFELRLPAVEFLLKTPEEVHSWNRCLRGRSLREFSINRKRSKPLKADHGDCERLHSSIFEYRNPFAMLKRGQDSWTCKLRPNRTPKSWLYLARAVFRYNMVFVPSMIVVIIVFLRMITPIMVTQKGFELNYKPCIRWLTSDSSLHHSNGTSQMDPIKSVLYELVAPSQNSTNWPIVSLSKPNSPLNQRRSRFENETIDEFWMPYVNLVTFNWYHLVRMCWDLFDTVMIYFQIALTMSSMGLIAVILIEDLVYHGLHLNKSLKHQIKILRSREMFHQINRDSIYANSSLVRLQSDTIFMKGLDRAQASSSSPLSFTGDPKMLSSSSIDIQAQVADIFSNLHNYNRYIQYQTLFLVTLWLSYSALVTSWMFIPGNDSPKLEWYIVHCFATSYLFIVLARFAEVKRCSRQMYKLISTAMALDDDYKFSKLTWMSLLQFYSPIPLHCFTFITKIELDILFGLKLLAWLASALIVTASFFNVYRLD